MNKIVREHYPVANLPEDLREGLEADATVRVVIESGEVLGTEGDYLDRYIGFEGLGVPELKPLTIEQTLEMIRKYRESNTERVTMENAVARIRELRDDD